MNNNTNEQSLVLVSAIRKTKHHVDVTYKMPESGDKFSVCWSNIHSETGNTELSYDLGVTVYSDNEDLASRVSEAIKSGESDDNADIELYLSVRDDFDGIDAKSLPLLLTGFETQYHSSKKHSSSNMSEYVRHNIDVFNEVNDLQAVYQNAETYYHGDYSLPSTKVALSDDGGTSSALMAINGLDEDSFDSIDDDFIKNLKCDHITTKKAVIETYWLLKHNNSVAEKIGDDYEPTEILWPEGH